jgi:hypothetical protein
VFVTTSKRVERNETEIKIARVIVMATYWRLLGTMPGSVKDGGKF